MVKANSGGTLEGGVVWGALRFWDLGFRVCMQLRAGDGHSFAIVQLNAFQYKSSRPFLARSPYCGAFQDLKPVNALFFVFLL